MSIGNLFNEEWYLKNNPDVRAAVEAGVTDARTHFEQYGRFEGRSPDPLFNPAQYLAANPDVQAAVESGITTAYDHFMQYGASEGRSPSNLFDPAFYLSQNPDVRAAVEAGLASATEHFLLYGQSEPRQINPFINLGDYLNANPDLKQAADAGAFSPLTHLLIHGAAEDRDLGNGINLGIFADDPAYQAAIQRGDFSAAMERVGEIAPFLPTFEPPAGWEPAPNTPIPTDFTPPEGTKLVIPPSVEVPDDMDLPDTFEPVEPVEPGPGPVDPGTPPAPSKNVYILKQGTDDVKAVDRIDAFIARAENSLETADSLEGRTNGTSTLEIRDGAIKREALDEGGATAPTISNFKSITNSHIGKFAVEAGVPVEGAVWLGLDNMTNVNEIWTNFATHGSVGPGVGVFYSLEEMNVEGRPTFGIKGVEGQENLGAGFAALSFMGAKGELSLALSGNKKGSYIKAGTSDNFDTVNIDVHKDNNGVIGLNDNVKEIVVTGEGNLSFFQWNYKALHTLDATDSSVNIQFGGQTGVGAEAKQLTLAENVEIKTGAGNDVINLADVTKGVKIQTGAGDDFISGGHGNDTISAGTGENVISLGGIFKKINGKFEAASLTELGGDDVFVLKQLSDIRDNDDRFGGDKPTENFGADTVIIDLDDSFNTTVYGFTLGTSGQADTIKFVENGGTLGLEHLFEHVTSITLSVNQTAYTDVFLPGADREIFTFTIGFDTNGDDSEDSWLTLVDVIGSTSTSMKSNVGDFKEGYYSHLEGIGALTNIIDPEAEASDGPTLAELFSQAAAKETVFHTDGTWDDAYNTGIAQLLNFVGSNFELADMGV